MSYGADLADKLPARRILRGQNPEGSQACRSAGGAADEVRAGDQSQDGEADRADDSAVGAVPGGQGDSVRELSSGIEILGRNLSQSPFSLPSVPLTPSR